MGFGCAPMTRGPQSPVRSQCSPVGGIILRAASESPLSHKSGSSLGKVLSLSQVPLRKLELRALSLLVTLHYLEQNSEVSIRTWEKQFCSNYTFCRRTSCFSHHMSCCKIYEASHICEQTFSCYCYNLSYPASLASVFLFHSFLSTFLCIVLFCLNLVFLFPLISNSLFISHSSLSDFLSMPYFYSDSYLLSLHTIILTLFINSLLKYSNFIVNVYVIGLWLQSNILGYCWTVGLDMAGTFHHQMKALGVIC